jgi:hypothetical protein
MVDRAKKAPGNVQPLPAASSMLILEASGRPFNISLDFRSGARPSPPPCGDVRARALERDRGPDLVKSRDLRSGAAVGHACSPIAMEGRESARGPHARGYAAAGLEKDLDENMPVVLTAPCIVTNSLLKSICY